MATSQVAAPVLHQLKKWMISTISSGVQTRSNLSSTARTPDRTAGSVLRIPQTLNWTRPELNQSSVFGIGSEPNFGNTNLASANRRKPSIEANESSSMRPSDLSGSDNNQCKSESNDSDMEGEDDFAILVQLGWQDERHSGCLMMSNVLCFQHLSYHDFACWFNFRCPRMWLLFSTTIIRGQYQVSLQYRSSSIFTAPHIRIRGSIWWPFSSGAFGSVQSWLGNTVSLLEML